MNTQQYETMMEGLISTAKEKFCCQGIEAMIAVEHVREVVADMEEFWNSDGETSNKDWEGEIDLVILDFKEQFSK